MAADFQDALGATDQIFKGASDTVNDWAKNLSSDFGIAKEEALKYSNLMGSMLINIGQLTEEQAAKQSAKLIELAGDLTAMYGGTTQDAVRALTGALKGNNTMLDNYGMAVNDALVKTRALELGLIAQGEEMTLAARQAATLSLIWEQSAAAQGQAAREADGASGSMRALQVEVKNLATSFGEILLPIITPIVSGIADMVNKIGSLSPELQKTIVVIGGIAAAIGPLMLGLGSLLKLAPLIGTAFTAMTGPIGIAVAAIAGATALIVANWDAIKEYFTSGDGAKVFETIKSMAVAIKDDVVTAFNAIKTAVKTIWNAIGDDIINIFGNALRIVMAALEVFVNTFKNVAQILHGIFTLDFKQALEGLKNLFNDIFNGIKKIVFSTISAISSALAGVFDFIGLDKWAEGLRSFSDKLSPSIEKVREETEKATEAATEAATVIEEVSDREVTAVSTASEKVVSATTSVSDTFTKLIGTNLSLQDSIKKTSDTIDELQSKLIKLQTGIISSTNVRDEIKTTQQQINDLSEALNLLTGGREINIDVKLKTDIGGDAQDFEDRFLTIADKVKKATAAAQTNLTEGLNNVYITSKEYNSLISSGITNMAGSIGEALGSGNFQDLGKGLIDAMGKLAQQFGSLLIGMGTAALHLKTTLITKPWLAIAAGAALVALGAAASAAASKMVNNATSGGGYDRSYSGGTSSYQQATPTYAPTEFRGPYQENYTVEFKIGTNELVGVLDMADQRKRRL
jgi:2-hydroxy-3-keto-5-methylthiopentenyl-1-phosphate phosphatase